MGYSIAVPVRSKKLQEKMMAFLEKEYRDAAEVLPEHFKYAFASRPVTEPHLAYDDGKCRIGNIRTQSSFGRT